MRHKTFLSILAIGLSLALLASACSSSDSKNRSAAVQSAGDPTTLAALPASSGVGERIPMYFGAVVTPSSWVSTSLSPTLSVPGATGAWTFSLTDFSDGTSTFGTRTYAESGTSTRVPLGAGLEQGATYTWTATSAEKEPVGGSFTVDLQMSGVQQTDSVGGVTVGMSSGEASFGWSSHSMGSVPGRIGFGLHYQTSNPDEVGLPSGWALQAATSFPYVRVETLSENAVSLIGTDGQVSNYRAGPEGSFVPVQSGNGAISLTGLAPVLVRTSDGSFAVTTKAATAIFSPDGESGVAYLSSISGGTSPQIEQLWKGGRLQSIIDPVSARKVEFLYGGSACPKVASGFIAAPDGLLCSVKFWDGTTSSISYVNSNSGPTIGRIVDFPEAKGDGAQVTDFAYDDVGRMARTRSPLVASAAASNVIDQNDQQFWTNVEYTPNGQVASMTAPAALAGAKRCTRSYEFETATAQIVDSCFGGPVLSVDFDPTTFFSVRTTNSEGLVAEKVWDFATGQLLRSTDFGGVTTVNVYDGADLIRSVGPTKGSLGEALVTARGYDETFAGTPEGVAMKGLDATYWAGSEASSEAVQELGPLLEGRPTAGLTVNWESSPAGNDGPWTGLMTGAVEVETVGEYKVVSSNTTARVRINNVLCVDSACDRLPLRKGTNSIHIDLASTQPGASMDISWSGPDTDGVLKTIPFDALRPAYGYITTTKSTDLTVRNAVVTNISRSSYEAPATGRISSRTNQAGSGMTFDYQLQGKTKWERQSSVTDGSGNSYRYTYWGDTESAKSPCPNSASVNQGGAAKETIAPGVDGGDGPVLTRQWVDAAGRAVATQSAGGATQCTTFGPAGDIRSVAIIGMGSAQTIVNNNAVGGNPLVKETTETDGESVVVTKTEMDLFGRPIQAVDRYGIISTMTYEERTGALATTTTTAPGVVPLVVSNTYDQLGRISASLVDGKEVSRLGYSADGLVSSVVYGNGVSAQAGYDETNTLVSMEWSTPSGMYSNSREVSAGGTTMSSTYSSPSASSTFAYARDDNGRLSSASVTAGLVPSSLNWNWTFDASSNRTRQTKLKDGSVVDDWAYSYNQSSQLISTTDPAAKDGITYDASGNATKVGPDSFTYDAANRLIAATDGEMTVTYERSVAGEIVTKTTEAAGKISVIRYSESGVLLNGDGQPYAKQLVLPFGVSFTKSLQGAPGNWQFVAINGDRFITMSDSGQLVGSPQVFDPYGNVLTNDVQDPTLPSTTWEAATGNEMEQLRTPYQLMGSRVYLPALGRFIQLDPKVGGSANGYDYVNQNPVDFSDPTGNESENWLVTGLAAIAATAAGMLLAPARGALVGLVVGAIAGAAVTGIATAIEYAATGQTSFSFMRLGLSMLAGAVGGSIAGRVKWAKAAPIRAEKVARENLEFLGGNAQTINQNAGWIAENAADINLAANGHRANYTSVSELSKAAATKVVRQQIQGVGAAERLMADPAFIDVTGKEGYERLFLYLDTMNDNARSYAAFVASGAR